MSIRTHFLAEVIVRFTREDNWKDTREEKNARQCAAIGEDAEKGRRYAQVFSHLKQTIALFRVTGWLSDEEKRYLEKISVGPQH